VFEHVWDLWLSIFHGNTDADIAGCTISDIQNRKQPRGTAKKEANVVPHTHPTDFMMALICAKVIVSPKDHVDIRLRKD
jgi:hypothetical protein